MSREPRILVVRLPWWPTERLALRRPELRARPFVTAAESRGRLIVAAASPGAARSGLVPGMPLADGRAIEPGVAVRPADPAADALALERLARWAVRFTPRVMPDGADALYLDIAGCARLFGGEAALLASLRTALKSFGLTARTGLSDTPGAAWALARHGGCDPAATPAGTGPDGILAALAPLPVAALRLGAETAEALSSFGLRRIGALAALEPAKLTRRFGAEPVRRLHQALGRIDEPIVPLRPPPAREARRAFAEPISRPEDVRAAVGGLLDDLCRTLGRSGEGARRLRLVCHRVDGRRPTVAIGTSRPLRRSKPLMGLFAEKLNQIAPGFGIDEIVLAADSVETLDEIQTDWSGAAAGGSGTAAGGSAAAREEELADLLDRLGNRFGFGRIARPAPRRSWLPERAVRSGRTLPPNSGARPAASASWPEERPRPLRLLSPPEPVEVEAASGAPAAAAPQALRRRGRLHRLRAAEGPERLECEWWREDAPRRDYYLVEDEDGRRCWLYLEGERWFLHGIFA